MKFYVARKKKVAFTHAKLPKIKEACLAVVFEQSSRMISVSGGKMRGISLTQHMQI